ncbi:uncharacterized protein LOC142330922 [Lycorma delicatula]|uniref:uncharacterized protein LOC142330922 n=1 Tax=Lycorma delicatula TaxID=130591 RepID=UPI003F50D80D
MHLLRVLDAVYMLELLTVMIVSCNLLCSKSRVAPLKQMTLPRLELCACLLLSCLQVTLALNERINEIHLYSDSMIALHWIHGQSTNWKVFVANRVSEIQQLTFMRSGIILNHLQILPIYSLGDVFRKKLINFVLWWHGPSWLLQDSFCLPTNHHFNSTETKVDPQCLVEKHQTVQVSLLTSNITDYTEKYSSLSKLIRVFTYCFRFIQNIKHKSTNDRKFDALSSNELKFTLEFFIHQSQLAYFKSEINDLQNQHFILKQSNKLSSLDPFLDYKGLLRVGGRLEDSNLSFDKNQLILHPMQT